MMIQCLNNEIIPCGDNQLYSIKQLRTSLQGINIMTYKGYIKLFRKSLGHWLYTEKRPLTKREAWENMLLVVNHNEKEVLIGQKLIPCLAGQSVRSLDSWASEFNWNRIKVRRFFKILEKENMIIIENLNYTTRITIVNFEKYQDLDG